MKWLLTVGKEADLAAISARLKKLGCKMAPPSEAIPLDNDELSVEFEGPSGCDRSVRSVPGVKGVYPSSDLSLY